jgi:uncharacterized surface protein with fasciclin (FAS1) repeats
VTAVAHAASCGDSNGSHEHEKSEKKADIVDTAVEAGAFGTLVTAVQAAGLEDALRGDGPLTVFAPTDEAFAALPEGTVEALLEDKDRLAAILKYHVVPGKVMAADVMGLEAADTLLGQSAPVGTTDGVTIAGAGVVQTDVKASNGVIHVIDAVMMPKDIVALAENAGTFNTLLTALEAAGLKDTLSSGGPFTVFAPTDDAFAKVPEATLTSLLEPENVGQLQAVLKYHVVPGRVSSSQVAGMESASTLEGSSLEIAVHTSEDGKVSKINVGEGAVIAADLGAANGTVHVVDTVLIPAQ